MDILRKKFISITKDDIKQTQKLLSAYGMTYVTAKREADELCGALNKDIEITISSGLFIEPSSGDKISMSASMVSEP